MKLLWAIVHIHHSFDLKLCASLVRWTRFRIKLFSTRARFLMEFIVWCLKFFIAKCTVFFLYLKKLYESFLFPHFRTSFLMIYKRSSCINSHVTVLTCSHSMHSTSKTSSKISSRSISFRFSWCALLNRNQWIYLLFHILLTINTYFI